MTRFWPAGQRIQVHQNAGIPLVFAWQGRRHRVEQITRRWRIDDGWWRQRQWREYFQLTTDTGLLVVVYEDKSSGEWFLQRVFD